MESKEDIAMRLPQGKTCQDCRHVERCVAFGFTHRERRSCDFYPNRFQPKSASK